MLSTVTLYDTPGGPNAKIKAYHLKPAYKMLYKAFCKKKLKDNGPRRHI
jgi:hypothetical protein